MICRTILFAAMIVGLAACEAQERSAGADSENALALDESEVRAIANEFAIFKGMTLLCDGTEEDHLTPFMEELRITNAPKELRDDVIASSVEMMGKISAEEPEYICTPEMFEGAEARVAQAELNWDQMRGLTQ